ncbi:hypothetical protein OE88DRAFT_1737831 [Heliocybe sulcata]|uniref:AB hydrolase-1 domain-containing protein n=1 Tax=Heliocybe sulcata TaxID=5364 RepID=A0A5C3MSU5_9AGAM|nr:hypothetical protein OE88DRAFT_1737831 [Heliocybe sulcata]
MPTAVIDSKGTEIYYIDSGAVPGSDNYTTLVIYHGSAFTGETFHKLLPLGAKDNVRVVSVNRKDYAGSTKYTDAELEDLNAGKHVFMERVAVDVANFLIWFADKFNVPAASADGKTGGFAVMGWSLGNATPTSLFAYPEAVTKERYAKLEPYVRQLILYDPPHLTYGYPQPPEGYNPFTDPAFKNPQEVFDNFRYWVSGYYNHAGLPTRKVLELDFTPRGARPSVDNMTPAEYAKNFDGLAAARTEFPMFFPMQPALNEMGQRAFFDEDLVKSVLPRTEVAWQVCENTNWYCAFGFVEAERQYKENVAKGKKVRPIKFQEIKGANHFVHWDAPEDFWAATAKIINGKL